MATRTPSSALSSAPPSRWGRFLSRIGLQGLGQLPEAVRPPATLAITGLPEQIAPLPAGVNTAITGAEGTAFSQWRQHLLRSLLGTAPVFVLAPTAAALDALLAHADLQDALAHGRLQAWVLPASAQSRIAAGQLPELLSDLHTIGLRPHHALFCADATPLLEPASLAQLARMSSQWLHWVRTRKQPSVWCFPLHPGQPKARSVVSAMARCFLYAAHLETAPTGSALMLERWDSPRGALFNTRYGVHHLPDGVTEADGSIMRGAQARMSLAPDSLTVYVTLACLHNLRTLPPHWEIVDDWQAAATVCQSAIGATVLLDAGTTEDFDALAALVHHLRVSHPPTLKIVVLETVAKLRTHHELALLHAGANDVLYKELRFARVVRRVQDLRDQVWLREIPGDWSTALQEFMPVPTHGYQAPEHFINLVRSMLDKAERLGLDHALVQLHMLPHVSHTMALKAFCGTRDGDLLTADQQSVWLFLFACREVDVDSTLPRLFSIPQDNLFSSQTSYSQIPGIAAQLTHLLEQNMQHPLPDYARAIGVADGASVSAGPVAQPGPFAPASAAPLPEVPQVHSAPGVRQPAIPTALQWRARPLGQPEQAP